jgi:Zn-dependent alcohol dehydrogenase
MVIEGDAVPQHFIPQLISLYERGLIPFDMLRSPLRPRPGVGVRGRR